MFEELAKVFAEHDSLPLGDFEARPCRAVMGGHSSNYPEVVRLNLKVDAAQLGADFLQVRDRLPPTFIQDRIPFMTHDWDSLQSYYKWLNVSGGVYKVLALRELGEVEPMSIVPEYTKWLLRKGFGCSTFKQQYATTGPNYRLRHHFDYRNFLKLGYRINIPVNTDSVVAFTTDGTRERRYKLELGHAYFFNVGRFHRAENVKSIERTNLIVQLTDDLLIENSLDADGPLLPFGEFAIPEGQEPAMSIESVGVC